MLLIKIYITADVKIDDQDVKIAFLVFLSFIISIFILSSILTFDYFNFRELFQTIYTDTY